MRLLGSSIRTRLLLLVLVATLPMLAFSAALLQRAYRVSIGLIEESAIGTARRVAVAVDAQISRAEAVGLALAQLPASELSDMSELEDAARRALAAAGLDSALVMVDQTGLIVAHTLRGARDVERITLGTDAAHRVFETGQPQVSDLFMGTYTHQWQTAVQVPVLRDGQVRYAISVMLSAAAITAGAAPDTLPERWFEVIADRTGRVINETADEDAVIGRELPQGLAALVQHRAEGFGAARIGQKESVLVGFTRSDRTGWLIGVGVPASLVRGPALRSIAELATGGACVLAASLGVAWLIGRNIARPLNRLAQQAQRLGSNQPPDARAGRGLAEAEAAAEALHLASLQLASRGAEREAALARAEASEARLEAVVVARTEELAQSEERFRTYFEHSSEALIVISVEGDRFVYETMNPSSERMFGFRAGDIAGRPVGDVLTGDTASQVLAGYRSASERGQPITLERTLVLPTGTLELETILVPVYDPDGEHVVRIISGTRDLTERKRIESRLAHAQRLEAVGQLTGGVAHDFNNLLTVIIGNLSLLRRRLGDDPRAIRYLTGVENAAERGARLTASLLAFSRRQALQVEQIDLAILLGECATLLQRSLGDEVALTLEIAPNLPPASADAGQLEAAVLNLAINARDAIRQARAEGADRAGWLRITVGEAALRDSDLLGNDEAAPGRFLAIAVRDSGAGMTTAVRARAFEPFFTTKEIGQGTGLGLSQVFGFVRQLGGHVTLESQHGHGTCVTMYVPASLTPMPAKASAAEPVRLPLGKTVLVVEDDANIRDISAEVLGDAGLTVITAESGEAALTILRGPARVDLLFSDVALPGGDNGVKMVAAARALRPDLMVLLTSGHSGEALSSYGADSRFEVLAKPYSRTALLERVGAVLSA